MWIYHEFKYCLSVCRSVTVLRVSRLSAHPGLINTMTRCGYTHTHSRSARSLINTHGSRDGRQRSALSSSHCIILTYFMVIGSIDVTSLARLLDCVLRRWCCDCRWETVRTHPQSTHTIPSRRRKGHFSIWNKRISWIELTIKSVCWNEMTGDWNHSACL